MSLALEEAQSRIDAPSQIGRTIGSYRILRQLGQGGMGAVFEVEHQDIGQHAAVKILHPEHASKKKLVDRFFDEARAISLVQHPGLVKVFDYARLEDGTVYILMELLQGESLWDRFTRLRTAGGWLPLEQVLRLSRQLAATLAAVHQKGVIHRDLKPENVVIVPDPEAMGGERAKILDFGIAKFAENTPGSTRRTTVGMVLGTPIYMSPEQCRGDDALTDRSDVYSLGVMIYEMLAGKPPFDNAAGGMIMASHIFRDPPALRALPNPPPEGVAQLVGDMLAKEPQKRPTMAQAVARLESLGVAGSLPALRLPTGGYSSSDAVTTVTYNPSRAMAQVAMGSVSGPVATVPGRATATPGPMMPGPGRATAAPGPMAPVASGPVATGPAAPRLSAEQRLMRRVPLVVLVGLPALLVGALLTLAVLPRRPPPPPTVKAPPRPVVKPAVKPPPVKPPVAKPPVTEEVFGPPKPAVVTPPPVAAPPPVAEDKAGARAAGRGKHGGHSVKSSHKDRGKRGKRQVEFID